MKIYECGDWLYVVLALLCVALALSGCGGIVDTHDMDPAARYAHDACECATDRATCLANVPAMIATLHGPGVDVACVVAYDEAMERRTAACEVVPMPTCSIFARPACPALATFSAALDHAGCAPWSYVTDALTSATACATVENALDTCMADDSCREDMVTGELARCGCTSESSCAAPIWRAPAVRYARAVCACGDGWAGCFANAYGEVRLADPACLDARAAGYEVDCTGRTNAGCTL